MDVSALVFEAPTMPEDFEAIHPCLPHKGWGVAKGPFNSFYLFIYFYFLKN
jgi:hypothetical protein